VITSNFMSVPNPVRLQYNVIGGVFHRLIVVPARPSREIIFRTGTEVSREDAVRIPS
jgi:hypothetical protein